MKRKAHDFEIIEARDPTWEEMLQTAGRLDALEALESMLSVIAKTSGPHDQLIIHWPSAAETCWIAIAYYGDLRTELGSIDRSSMIFLEYPFADNPTKPTKIEVVAELLLAAQERVQAWYREQALKGPAAQKVFPSAEATNRPRKSLVRLANGDERRRMTVYLSLETNTALRAYCEAERYTVSEVVSAALREYLARRSSK